MGLFEIFIGIVTGKKCEVSFNKILTIYFQFLSATFFIFIFSICQLGNFPPFVDNELQIGLSLSQWNASQCTPIDSFKTGDNTFWANQKS